jgi:glutamate racemase
METAQCSCRYTPMPHEINLLAGTGYIHHMTTSKPPIILVFDSGLGGITVFTEALKARPDACFIYAADDAAFPYGALSEDDLVARILKVVGKLIETYHPDIVIVACNTASTLVLPALRARFVIPFVGTVPAIKPAAELSKSRMFSVLATPGTVARDYTQGLIRNYAGDCDVTLVGSRNLAGFAEAHLRGEAICDEALRVEIASCFITRGDRRTDVVTLSCTHYPLLLDRFEQLAPWPVIWIDPAPAIARRMKHVLGKDTLEGFVNEQTPLALFTCDRAVSPALMAALRRHGLPKTDYFHAPLVQA